MHKFPGRVTDFRVVLPSLVLAAAIVFAGCGKTDEAKPRAARQTARPPAAEKSGKTAAAKPEAEEVQSPPLRLVQKGITLQWVEKGVLRTSATAKSVGARLVNDRGEIVGEMKGFSAKLYENGKLAASMTAPKALVDTPNRTITATGGVVLKSIAHNTVIKCEWAKWFERKQKVVGNGGVDIESDTLKAQAAAFIWDTRSDRISLRESAKGLQDVD